MSYVPVLIGKSTYGRYYETTGYFECSHGGWGSDITITKRRGNHYCTLSNLDEGVKEFPLIFLDTLPEDYNYT